MIPKLRRKFVAVVMGAAAFLLLAVFVVLLVSTQTGMERQSMDLLRSALDSALRKDGFSKQAPQLPDDPPTAENEGKNKKWNGRFHVFTALVDSSGNVTVPDKASFLQEELDAEAIEELVRTAAASDSHSGVLPSSHLRYLKRDTENGVAVAFADTTGESSAMAELVKNSLIVGLATLLVFFGASLLLARWAVRPVEKAWRQQKQFVGDASHELKTPLTVILSNADMLLSHPEEPPRRWAENIKAESVRMKHLTEELLSLARSEDTQRKPVLQRVDFSYLVTDSVLLFEASVFESGKTLSYDVEEGIHVVGDAPALSQLLGILLDNAVKYSPEGGTIALRLETAGRNARLSVSNTGQPIPDRDLPHIFERFYRGDPSRQSTGGHGLGLAIARSIVEAHKGKIWAECRNGLNIFTTLLPCEKKIAGK